MTFFAEKKKKQTKQNKTRTLEKPHNKPSLNEEKN